MRATKSQSGVMLIEALIGMLIFSIGILAMIGMQATAMRNTTDARYRSEAAFLATQIVGQMWVDRANLMSYTTAGYAPRDAWATQVSATLPGVGSPAPAPSIAVGAGNEVTVTIQWRQPGESLDRKVTLINRINGS